MAKAYKHANKICLALSVLAGLGAIIGLVQSSVLVVIFTLLPATIYEAYRTEGKSTKAASWGMLGVLVGELLLIVLGIDINIAEFLQQSQGFVGGFLIPFGGLQVLAPTLLGILSVILIQNTRGKYTIWLAIVNLVGALAIVYILDPTIFTDLLRIGVQEGIRKIN